MSPLTWGNKPDPLHAMPSKVWEPSHAGWGPKSWFQGSCRGPWDQGPSSGKACRAGCSPIPTGAGFRVHRQSSHNTHNRDPHGVLSHSFLRLNFSTTEADWEQHCPQSAGGNPQIHRDCLSVLSNTALKWRGLKTLVPVLLSANLPLYRLGEGLW